MLPETTGLVNRKGCSAVKFGDNIESQPPKLTPLVKSHKPYPKQQTPAGSLLHLPSQESGHHLRQLALGLAGI